MSETKTKIGYKVREFRHASDLEKWLNDEQTIYSPENKAMLDIVSITSVERVSDDVWGKYITSRVVIRYQFESDKL